MNREDSLAAWLAARSGRRLAEFLGELRGRAELGGWTREESHVDQNESELLVASLCKLLPPNTRTVEYDKVR